MGALTGGRVLWGYLTWRVIERRTLMPNSGQPTIGPGATGRRWRLRTAHPQTVHAFCVSNAAALDRLLAELPGFIGAKAPGRLGKWLQKPFSFSRRAADRSAGAGRRTRGSPRSSSAANTEAPRSSECES